MCSALRVLRLGSCVPRPSQKENERERRNHQKTPRTVPDRPATPHPFPGVSCRSFFPIFMPDFLRSVFVFASWTFLPSWFRHRVPRNSSPHLVL